MHELTEPIDVWSLRFPDLEADREGCMARLSDDERRRASTYLRKQDAGRFILARGTLRVLLGRAEKTDPAALTLRNTPHGKPYLPGSALHFNLSHSRDRLLIAITRDRRVGVDLEYRRDEVNHTAIAKRWFTPGEQEQIRMHGDPISLFFDLWAGKEAYVKAVGRGIYTDFSSIEMPAEFPSAHPLPIGDGSWLVQSLAVDATFSAALVYEAPSAIVRIHTTPR